MKKHFSEQVLKYLDTLDPESLKAYVKRIASEKTFMETIAIALREGIIVIDSSRVISYYNPAAAELIGLPVGSEGEVIDRFLKSVPWEQMSRQHGLVSRREIELFYPQHRILNFYMVPHVTESQAKVHDYIVILNDVTEQRKASEEALENSQSEVISMMAASVAHEIGNPLNGINLHLQLLERMLKRGDALSSSEGAADAVKVAREELSRLDQIISRFLKTMRPSELITAPVSLSQLLEDCLKVMQLEIQNKDIQITADWGDAIPQVLADADQLKQAFLNIIKNAVNAMPNGGELNITCTLEEAGLAINFQDSGGGINAREITRVMDPYYTTSKDGNGLGLLVVERIIRAHGGQLNIHSKAERGTLLQIVLPLSEKVQRSLPLPSENSKD